MASGVSQFISATAKYWINKNIGTFYFFMFPAPLPVVHGAMSCGQKNFKLVWQCHLLLSRFLAKDHLPGVASVTSVVNDKGDNEMIMGAVYRSPQLGDL